MYIYNYQSISIYYINYSTIDIVTHNA